MSKALMGWKVIGRTKRGTQFTHYSGTEKRAKLIGKRFFKGGSFKISKLTKKKYL